jgi:endonuclease/exonuclease/phosphatase (EEP) superfamily protein YafD
LTSLFFTVTYVYYMFLFGWAGLRALGGDRWWWLHLLNTFALYMFAPLPLLTLATLALRRHQRIAWAGAVGGLLLGALLYGDLFLPRYPVARAESTTLRVVTSNILGYNTNAAGIVAAIRESDADVVALQELGIPVAEAIENDLLVEYPYQVLDPRKGVSGMGIISRYPMRPAEDRLYGDGSPWVTPAQQMLVTFEDNEILFINFHAVPPYLNPFDMARMEEVTRLREDQARWLVEAVRSYGGPALVVGDLNAGDMSQAHAIMTSELTDVWREAGWGMGHTFPGSSIPGSSRMRIGGVLVPKWLVRIDYIFHSAHWQTVSADIAPWDGQSDHRPVMSDLHLR